MRFIVSLFLFLFLLANSFALAQFELPTKKQLEAIVFLLMTDEQGQGQCTGFYSGVREIMTAAHCHTDNMVMLDSNGIIYPLKLTKIDKEKDLATYWTDKNAPYVYELRDKEPAYGEWLWIFSRMGPSDEYLLVHSVQVLNPHTQWPSMAEFFVFMTPRLIPGQSGSPVIDARGQLLSVAVRTAHPMTPILHTGLGVPWSDIKAFQ